MTLIQIFNNYFKKKTLNLFSISDYKFRFENFKFLILLSLIVLFTIIYFSLTNFIEEKNKENIENLNTISKSNDFLNISNYFISKINSPYKEINYTIRNNDSIGKILKKNNIKENEINNIVEKLKEKKLSSIYTGRELKLILKKNDEKLNSMINLIFPVSNTNSVEVRKIKDNFIVKENIVKLYKKEVVIKSEIKNNLYTSAINSGIEPNIIVEFARVFGFEVDFQRDIRKRGLV